MSQRVLICVVILFCLKIASVNAQPTLDPSQTVNTATGEMGFSLPLGVVKGNNGHDAPIMLNYQAGIQLRQPASNIGLGFSMAPGVISRQVVIIPDEITIDGYHTTCNEKVHIPWWYFVATGVLCVLAIIMSIFQQHYGWGFFIGAVIAISSTAANLVLSRITYGSQNYIAGGGNHVPALTVEDGKRPAGFYYEVENPDKDDLPDIFTVSTPYISGQMYFDKKDRHFKMRQSGGSPLANLETVKIVFDSDKFFTIITPDGIKLEFKKVEVSSPDMFTFHQEYKSNTEIYATIRYKTTVPVISAWFLTGVAFNDYIDANDNKRVDASDLGSWIQYSYDEEENRDALQIPFSQQASTNATTVALNRGLHNVYLLEITTPLEHATLDYKDERLDDLWFTPSELNYTAMTEDFDGNESNQRSTPGGAHKLSADSWHSSQGTARGRPVNRKTLEKITIYNKGKEQSIIEFKQDYSLRPKTFSSFTKDATGNFVAWDTIKNSGAGSLTLKSIIFSGPFDQLGDIKFTYSELNPDGWNENFKARPQFPDHDMPRVSYYMEAKDLWGYYYPLGTTQARNEFPWEIVENTSTPPYAEAWSMKSVSFSNGMRINWEYEANKYDKSNDRRCNKDNGAPRAGGGIRVKQVTTNDGRGNDYSLDYFYTTGNRLVDWTDDANDSCNSSGYVPVHPYNYIGDNDGANPGDGQTDYRTLLNLAKGGLYTPTKVCYEMVKVAQNYDRTRKIAPLGYTLQQYTSTIEYPNSGTNSDIDRSVVRGLPIKTAVYDKNGKLITKDATIYNVIANPAPSVEQLPDYWVSVKKVKEYANGIETEKEMSYAQEGTKDAVVSEKLVPLNNYYKKTDIVDHVGLGYDIFNRYNGDFEYGTFYGDPGKKDIIAGVGIMHNDDDGGMYVYRRYFLLALGEDIEFSATQTSYNWKYGILKYPFGAYVENSDTSFIDAFAVADLNNNGKQDAIILETEDTYNKIIYRVGFDIEPSLFTGSGGAVELASLNVANPTGITFDRENEFIACAGIKNIVSSTSKDLVLVLYTPGVHYQIVILAGLKNDGTYTKIYQSDPILDNVPRSDLPYVGVCLNWQCDHGASISADIVNLGGSYPDIVLTKFTEPRVKKIFEEIHVTDSPDKVLFEQNEERLKYPVGGIQNIEFTGVQGDFFKGVVYPDDGEYGYQKPVYTGIELFSYVTNFYCINQIIGTTPVYFDYDGQPNRVIEKRGSFEIVSEATPAYWEYQQMDATHLLTPVCRNTSYQSTAAGPNWVAASVATWGQDGTFWFPKASYVWKVNMTAQGTTTEAPPVFSYTNYALNNWNKWKLVDSTGKYNSNRNFVEAFKPGVRDGARTGNVAVVTKNGLQTAQVINANFKECAVFTGEYDQDENGYFDLENGWEKGAGNTGNGLPSPASYTYLEAKHFGNAGIKVHNAFGPTRNIKLTKDRNYILSAWIKPAEGNLPIESHPDLVMDIDYRMSRDPVGTVWPIPLYAVPTSGANPDDVRDSRPCSGNVTWKKYGDWYLVKKEVPAVKDLKDWWDAGYQYARFWVGCPSGNGNTNISTASATVYIDDIRFYPANALVTSTYFNDHWKLPTLSVDANNNPGKRVVYDWFGRVSEIRKVSKTDITNTTLIEKKEYHLHSDLLQGEDYKILYPDGKECFLPGKRMTISWTQKEEKEIRVICSKVSDGSSDVIVVKEFDAGRNEYTWQLPADYSGYYKMYLVASSSGTIYDGSDEPFKVETSPNVPVLLSPANNATGVSQTGAVFEWSCSDNDGDELTYTVRIASSTNNYPFTTKVSPFTIPMTLDAGRNYTWRIEAEDQAGHIIWSENRYFTTE
jgi:hypothetical protein